MITKLVLPTLALDAALTAGPLAAQTIELVTGVGFGASQPEAFQNAIRAWLTEAIKLHETAGYGSALTTDVSCFEQQAASGPTTQGIEVIGDPTAPWSCSVQGIPASAIGN